MIRRFAVCDMYSMFNISLSLVVVLNKTVIYTSWTKVCTSFLSRSNRVVFPTAMKEERYRYGSGFDQMEDVMGVAQPVRFNSKTSFPNRSADDQSECL